MSKFSLPYLKHECVPKTWFLDRVEQMPKDLENYVVKPLFSFAGLGVIINVTPQDLAAIPREKRSQYILQERMNFEPVVETPFGGNKMEVRVMYIWLDELLPVMTIIRMGRGLMMGVDHNRNMEWVGSSAGFYDLKLYDLHALSFRSRVYRRGICFAPSAKQQIPRAISALRNDNFLGFLAARIQKPRPSVA